MKELGGAVPAMSTGMNGVLQYFHSTITSSKFARTVNDDALQRLTEPGRDNIEGAPRVLIGVAMGVCDTLDSGLDEAMSDTFAGNAAEMEATFGVSEARTVAVIETGIIANVNDVNDALAATLEVPDTEATIV
jgi:hypothetical protein